MNKYDQFQKENNEILKYILDDRFFSRFKEDKADYLVKKGLAVELYVTSVCNQKCDYCYLTKHGDELYPKEIRNIDQIIENMKILFNYFIEQNLYIYDLDLFSGEIWGMKFGNKVLDIILDAVKNGLKIKYIMIPSNCSFILDKKTTKVIQAYINEFQKYDVALKFSASVDGKFLESEMRSYNNESVNIIKNSDEFYKNLFNFCIKNGYGFHPMVSSKGIEKWTKNFDWWMKKIEEYRLKIYNCIMFLEVRNDDWTNEKIKEYLLFLNHVVDWMYTNYYKYDITAMMNDVFLHEGIGPQNYNIIDLTMSSNNPGCTIYRALTIRLGDLSIVPCHRLSYSKFNYGKFIVKNNKIVDIEANNIQFANSILYTSTRHAHKCDVCTYNNFCMRGCHGSQFEATKDPLIPCNTVCNLFKAKINFLIYKYEKMGMLNKLKSVSKGNSKKSSAARYILDNINIIRKGKEYQEWKKSLI